MKRNILDLDDRSTWSRNFEKLLFSDEVWAEIRLNLCDEEKRLEFFSQITCGRKYLSNPFAKNLRVRGQSIFQISYTHVAAYHGCRPKNRNTYLERGVLPSNTKLLIKEARDLFKGITGFDEAVRDIGCRYLNHNEGKVGFLQSAIWAKKYQSDYAKGSELVRGIACRLGEKAEALYEGTGAPTLVKCMLQLDWIDRDTVFPMSESYVTKILWELIRLRWEPDENVEGFQGGFLLTRPVPPENILEFINMS